MMPPPPTWTQLASVKVSARSPAIWQKAIEWVSGPLLLKFEATGTWQFCGASGTECSPDGDLSFPIALNRCISDKAPIGSLIGRIGGSTSQKDDPESVFPIGTFCIYLLSNTKMGPVFLTINDIWTGFGDNNDEVEVTISWAPVPAVPPA
jgi:hypothetical protein